MNTPLHALRARMNALGLRACLIPSSDPHLSEYLPPHWQTRAWLSGFSGSVATLIVCDDFAGLWVDSRYWTQAEQELAGREIELIRVQSAASTDYLDFLAEHLRTGDVLAVNGDALSQASARALQTRLDAQGVRIDFDADPVADVWHSRPALPQAPVYEHPLPFATQSRAEKLTAIRTDMAAHGANVHWLSTLDDIAWLTNLRGSDVDYNPVFLAHLLLTPDTATLFVAPGKLAPALQDALLQDGITLAPYTQAKAALRALNTGQRLLLDSARVTRGFAAAVPAGVAVIDAINPSTLRKAQKTAAQAAHIRTTMEEDGVALAEFFAWFEAAQGKQTLTELTVDAQLTAARARRPGFVSQSFATIAGFNAAGALPHYRARANAYNTIEGDGLLLIDSGGQYLGGTTDITRVVAIGTPSDAQRADFTRVLQGVIALSSARFPRGTPAPMLDALARAPLWQHQLDFGHGVGHGVGYFLNVHEGPQSLSRTLPTAQMAMQPGMVTSIEPGLYRPGRWGVRIENLVLNVAAGSSEFGEFLAFETLTLCPIDTRCLARELLLAHELAWLNQYHAEVRRRLLPRLDGAARAWLLAATEPLA